MTMCEDGTFMIDPSRVAMACFLEGVDPAALSLAPRHLIQVEHVMLDLRKENPTIAYHRCLESLASDSRSEAV